MKKILLLLSSLCTLFAGTFRVFADEKVTFEINAPMIVSVGEAFRVEFALNAKPDSDTFVAPTFEGFDVMAGPAVSTGTSIQIVNGKTTKSVNYSITYVLLPQEEGEFRIGEAEINVKNKTYRSRPTIIEVRASQQDSQQGGGQATREDNSSIEAQAGNQIGRDDLLLRLALSRNNLYKGEATRATLKLYSRVNVAGSEGAKMPAFNGFWSHRLDSEQGPFRETLNGKVYEVYNIAEWLLYPQKSGDLSIEPSELTVVVQVVVQGRRSADPFEAFFGGGHQIYNLRRELRTPSVTVHVKDLPEGAPASFSGAVGRYEVSSSISTHKIAANSAANITARIAGTGNLQFLQAPHLNLPASFELYDIKTTDKISTSVSGSTGYREFEYPFIARAEGEYVITPLEFTYFNPDTNKYVTLSTEEEVIEVTPDTKSATSSGGVVTQLNHKEDVRLLGNDIRFIKLGRAHLRTSATPLMLSPLYWVLICAIVLLHIILYLVLQKYLKDSRNTVLVRGRRANKVAVQRFRQAAKYMKNGERHAFYEEMLRALWGYLSDRFNIPVSDLTKESAREELARRGASDEAQRVTAIISACEEAQYSSASSSSMEEVYADGIDIISRIESAIKR